MERIFTEMNQHVINQLSGSFPAEGLSLTEPPKYHWKQYSRELAERLHSYPKPEQDLYTQAVNRVLRGVKLSERMEFMKSAWNDRTSLEYLRQLNIEDIASLPQVGHKTAERAMVLLQ